MNDQNVISTYFKAITGQPFEIVQDSNKPILYELFTEHDQFNLLPFSIWEPCQSKLSIMFKDFVQTNCIHRNIPLKVIRNEYRTRVNRIMSSVLIFTVAIPRKR